MWINVGSFNEFSGDGCTYDRNLDGVHDAAGFSSIAEGVSPVYHRYGIELHRAHFLEMLSSTMEQDITLIRYVLLRKVCLVPILYIIDL